MKTIFFSFLGAVILATLFTPVSMRIAFRFGVVDKPGGRRIHAHPIPRIGGIAIAVAFWCCLGLGYLLSSSFRSLYQELHVRITGLIVGGFAIVLVGLVDDIKGIRAKYKLAWQIGAALIAYAAGLRIDAISLPGLGTLSMSYVAAPITVFWIVGVINAINLIDGLDGLAGGIVFFASISGLIVTYIQGDEALCMVSAALAGSTLGFLVFNFHPAKVFMGDSGSMFLGFTLASLSLMGSAIKSSTTIAILVPLIALGIPILDTLFAIVRRFLEKRPIFSPDRGHIHHVLLDLGLTQRRAVTILYMISVALTLSAIATAMGHDIEVGGALIVLSIAVFLFFKVSGWSPSKRGKEEITQKVPVAGLSNPMSLSKSTILSGQKISPSLRTNANHTPGRMPAPSTEMRAD